MAGGCTKHSCNRPNFRPNCRHSLEKNISCNRICFVTSLHGVPPFENLHVELPDKIVDSDQPTKCPVSEGCIMQDVLMWKETLSATLQYTTELISMGWHEDDAGNEHGSPIWSNATLLE